MKWKAKLLIYRVLAYAMDSVWALIFSSFLKDLLTAPRIEPLRSWRATNCLSLTALA
jgi:hypothetical protein